jgi:hypothetical protein
MRVGSAIVQAKAGAPMTAEYIRRAEYVDLGRGDATSSRAC